MSQRRNCRNRRWRVGACVVLVKREPHMVRGVHTRPEPREPILVNPGSVPDEDGLQNGCMVENGLGNRSG